MTTTEALLFACWGFGLGTGWSANNIWRRWRERRERRRTDEASRFDPGDKVEVITLTDGSVMRVVATEAPPASVRRTSSASPEKP